MNGDGTGGGWGGRLLPFMIFSFLVIAPLVQPSTSQGISPIVLRNVELVTVDEDSAVITWTTNLPSDTKVQWGTDQDMLEEKVVNEQVSEHMASIEYLLPNTTYYYRVGSGDAWGPDSGFVTLLPPEGMMVLQFAIIADPHYDTDGTNNVAGNMYGDGPALLGYAVDELNNDLSVNFAIVTGDMTNSGNADDFHGFAETMNRLWTPWYPVLGNWDKVDVNWERNYMNATGRDESYYSFDMGGYHFVILDSAVAGSTGGSIDDSQLAWLSSDLNGSRTKPTMIFLHHRADGTGDYGLDAASKGKLDAILAPNPQAFSLTAGHNHMNTVSIQGKRIYVTTAATVSYPVGYSIVRLYKEGYSQSFHKIKAGLEVSEESRNRQEASGADPNADQQFLGELEDRTLKMPIPSNKPPVVNSMKADHAEVAPGDTAGITVSATDPDGDKLTYSYDTDGGRISGSGSSVTWTAPEVEGTFMVTVVVSDGSLSSVPKSIDISVTETAKPPPPPPPPPPEEENRPPVIDSIQVVSALLLAGGSTDVTVDAYDPDGDALTYQYEVDGGSIIGSGSTVTFKAPNVAGTYSITARVSDGEMVSDAAIATVSVRAPKVNHAPVLESATQSVNEVLPGGEMEITVTASDEDGDVLVYHYAPSDGTIEGKGSKVRWSAPSAPGSYTVDVWVSDDGLSSGKKTLNVTVKEPPKTDDAKNVPGFDAMAFLLAIGLVSIAAYGKTRRM